MTNETAGERYWLTKVSGTACPARAGSRGRGPLGGHQQGGLSLAPLAGRGAAPSEHPLPLPDTNNAFKVSSPNWLLLNLNVSGYFRVNYNQENWDQLLSQLSTNHQVHGAVAVAVAVGGPPPHAPPRTPTHPHTPLRTALRR